ncbi:MAG: hypothetical protein NC548_39700 [Lachnospiraceae bacterium]|nr:hypothetical protein [Lachnospiraceae bacterium]
MEIVDLRGIADGALQEKFQAALEEVLRNMQDPNTPWKNKREITIRLKFIQNEERNDTACEISVEKKLAQPKSVMTKFAVGRDLSTGRVEAVEYGPGIKGQMSLDDFQESGQDKGSRNTVVDFRSAK